MRTTMTRWCAVLAGSLLLASAVAAQPVARPPQGPPGTVTLSLADYDRLVDQAERPARPPDPPPIPATIARADGTIRIGGDHARGTYTLQGEVFAPGVTKVPLISGTTIVDAKLGAAPLALTREGALASALIDGPRPFAVTLDWGVPLAHAPGRATLVVPTPMAGAVNATFELPSGVADVRIQPGAITRIVTASGVTRVETTLVPGSDTALSWASRRSDATARRDVRAVAAVRSLVTLRDSEIRLAALIELSVLSGQPDRVDVAIPDGFTYAGGSGAAVDAPGAPAGIVSIRVERPTERRHQFLVSFERQGAASGRLEVPLPSVPMAERESGEVAIEAAGTVQLDVHESVTLRRMDVREASGELLALSGAHLLAAMRYQRRGGPPAAIALDVTRYPDAPLITAVADRAVATTLVTADGRTLTEVALRLRNRAQPFLRVELPQGAAMISAEVAGEAAKLAQAPDGTRVPLLRPGFLPNGPYDVSFVFVHAGAPLAKKGRASLLLPKMDVPVGLVEWELFVPDRYRVKRFDGDALLEPAPVPSNHASQADVAGIAGGLGGGIAGAPGDLVGQVTDSSGAVIPGVTITALRKGRTIALAVTDSAGWFQLPANGPGRVKLVAELSGFKRREKTIDVDPRRPARVDLQLEMGSATETVTVMAESGAKDEALEDAASQAPSQNVFNLQRRVEGVLPVQVEVPRAGAAYRLVRPLVLDETTTVSFDYRRR